MNVAKLPDLSEAKMGKDAFIRERNRKIYLLREKGLSFREIAKSLGPGWTAAEVKAQCEWERLFVENEKAEERELSAKAGARASALIKRYVSPDHKVTDMAAFRSALVKAFKQALGEIH